MLMEGVSKLLQMSKDMAIVIFTLLSNVVKRLYHTVHASLMFGIIFLPIILLITGNTFGLSPVLLVLVTIFNTYIMYEDLK